MRCALPSYHIRVNRLLKSRDEIVNHLITELGNEVNRTYSIPSSTSKWSYDEQGDVIWEYDIHGIIGTAKHLEVMNDAKELWTLAREEWPEALTHAGFVSAAMSVNTEGLDDESFATIFREHINRGE